MDKIKIITDSTSDLPKEILDNHDVEVIPLLINFGEESYLDGVDINLKQLLERVEKDDTLPTTAQITPVRFTEYYEKYLKEGYKIVSIHLSSNMSGTYQSACIAKEMLETDDIVVIDSQTVTSGMGILVLEAARLRDEGLSIEEIKESLDNIKTHIKSSLAFESLDNLVRGGRISKATGMIGSVLGIRLILEVKDGLMAVKTKMRGSKKAVKQIIQDFEELGHKEGTPVVLLHVENKDVKEGLEKYLGENNIEYIDAEVGCTVGIHSGPKAAGLFFIENY